MLPVFNSTVSIPFITSLCKSDIIFTFFIWILLLYISPSSFANSIIPNASYPFVLTVPLKNVFSIFLSSSFLYIYFPIISYSVSASNPVTIISPACVYVLLKYIFPSLYISNVGASIILAVGSFIVSVLFAEYTSAVNSSAVTSGFMYLFSWLPCSLFSDCGSCCGSSCLSSLGVVSFSFLSSFSCLFSSCSFAVVSSFCISSLGNLFRIFSYYS